jgi:4-hydroxy-2-oxoheptanedioate aldolase
MAKGRSSRPVGRGVPANRTKAKAQAGQIAQGALLTFHSPETVEMLGALGFDFVTLDLEHEAYNELALVHSIRAAEAFGMTPIVRLANDPDLILRLLDAGAQGIHVPRVNTRKDAQQAVEASRFYPQGKRTFYATGRSGNYGIGLTEEEYAEASNRETLVILQVEEQEGIDNLEDILSVPNVDAIQFGPKDLWQSMGMPDRSEVWRIIDRSLAQVAESGKWGSMVCWLDSDVRKQQAHYKDLGVRLVTASPKELLGYGARYYLDQAIQAPGR